MQSGIEEQARSSTVSNPAAQDVILVIRHIEHNNENSTTCKKKKFTRVLSVLRSIVGGHARVHEAPSIQRLSASLDPMRDRQV